MGKKGSKWKEAAAEAQIIYKKRARDVISYGNSKIIKTSNSNNSSNSSNNNNNNYNNNNKRCGSIWLRHPFMLVSFP